MNLKNYILEYVSSGRGRNKGNFPFDKTLTVENIKDWLDDLGIEGTKWGEGAPNVWPGELSYYCGPCESISSTWIALYNNLEGFGTDWTQELCIWPVKGGCKWRLTTVGNLNEIESRDIRKLIIMMNEMVKNPTEKIEI